MFDKIKSVFNKTKAKGIEWQDGQRPGCPSTIPMLCCNTDKPYDNAFPDIVRIAEAFAEVMPYAIDANGRRLAKQPQLMRALYNPNEEMSGSDFLETLITMLLVHPLVHILCYHYENGEPVPGGPITPENIAGFIFLEDAFVSRVNGRTTFRVGDRPYTRDDVITLSLNVNPYSVLSGYSPTQAIKKWATVDDYIAEYQAAQFANGGTPAGVMSITAPTIEDYNKAVDRIIAAHTGPNNANRIVYTHRPTSSIDGKPMSAGVEWTPFAQTNKELTLDSLFNQANKKIDMNFGVPEEVKGYLQNSNYASAEVADYVFARRILYPKLVKVYSKFTHEMNRITGGLGFAVSFDHEPPVLTDMRKVQAETLGELLDRGFSVKSAVEALKLPRSFLQLDKENSEPDQNLQVEDSTQEKPRQADISKTVTYCCDKHKALDLTIVDEFTDPTLKSLVASYLMYVLGMVQKRAEDDTDIPAVLETINDVTERVGTDATAGKLRTLIVGQLYYLLTVDATAKSAEYAELAGLNKPVEVLTADQRDSFNTALQNAAAVATTAIANYGAVDIEVDAIITESIASIDNALNKYGLSAVISIDRNIDTYHEQLVWLLDSFAVQTLEQLSDATLELTEAAGLVGLIASLTQNSDYRVTRWATSEQHRAEELGTLLAAEETGDIAELEPYKVWHAHKDKSTCANCIALDGTSVRADKEFGNGNMVPHDHPHCRCWMTIEFRERAKAVKITCPHCKRYMFESSGGVMKNVICANSKCKKHFDFEIDQGKIKYQERSA